MTAVLFATIIVLRIC